MKARLVPAWIIFTHCFCLTCGAASADSFLIVPGKQVGQTHLGPDGSEALNRLSSPDVVDAGMSQRWLAWTSKGLGSRNTLYIHTVNNAATVTIPPRAGVTIDTIRVTSPRFHTLQGVSTASTLASIRRFFPASRPVPGHREVYDDPRHGISFEFRQPVTPASRCIGIAVYTPKSGPPRLRVTQADVDRLLRESPVKPH